VRINCMQAFLSISQLRSLFRLLHPEKQVGKEQENIGLEI